MVAPASRPQSNDTRRSNPKPARGHHHPGIPVKLHSRKVLGVELFPMAGIREMTLPRYIELQWQREVVERWLNSSDTPFDVRSGLLDILSKMKEEIEKERLEAALNHLYEHTTQRASRQ